MNNRDKAINIVNMMDEEQLVGFISLFHNLVSDIPNEETIVAMQEAEAMLADPNAQRFTSVEELFAELKS